MEAPQIQPPPNPVKNAPTITPQVQRFDSSALARPHEVEHPQYGAHQSVPQKFDPNGDPEGQFKSQQEHFKQEQENHKEEFAGVQDQYQSEQKAHEQDRKTLYRSLSSRIKSATDVRFRNPGNSPASWGSKDMSQLMPGLPTGNLFNQEKNPMLHAIYNGGRGFLMSSLAKRHAFAGLQPDMEIRAGFDPLIQRQIQAGMGRYDPSRDKMMQGLQQMAKPWIEKFTGGRGGLPGANV